MKAQEARALSMTIHSGEIQKQIEEASQKIKAACDKGELSCVYFGTLLPGSIQQLKEDGYKIHEREDNDKGIPMTFYEINW